MIVGELMLATFFFSYTIVLLVLAVVTGSTLLSSYFVTRREIYLSLILFSAVYFLELIIIFWDEYARKKFLVISELSYDGIPFFHPYIKTLLSIIFVLSIWWII